MAALAYCWWQHDCTTTAGAVCSNITIRSVAQYSIVSIKQHQTLPHNAAVLACEALLCNAPICTSSSSAALAMCP